MRPDAFAKFEIERKAEEAAAIARHARMLELARHNDFPTTLHKIGHLPGEWWEVPAVLVPMVGAMVVRVS